MKSRTLTCIASLLLVAVSCGHGVEPDNTPAVPEEELQCISLTHGMKEYVLSLTLDGHAKSVDWGDGSTETYREGLKHVYTSGGTHTIKITGTDMDSFMLAPAGENEVIDLSSF